MGILRDNMKELAAKYDTDLQTICALAIEMLSDEAGKYKHKAVNGESELPDLHRYWTVDDLKELWSCSDRTVYEYLRSGELKGIKVGRSWIVSDMARISFENRLAEMAEEMF